MAPRVLPHLSQVIPAESAGFSHAPLPPPLPPRLQLLLCSLYEIYLALEEEMDRNCDHPSVAPIYFPAELARLAAIEKDLEFFFGQDWREKVVVPAATRRYCHRIRQVRLLAC